MKNFEGLEMHEITFTTKEGEVKTVVVNEMDYLIKFVNEAVFGYKCIILYEDMGYGFRHLEPALSYSRRILNQ